jgi:hypothetical protein
MYERRLKDIRQLVLWPIWFHDFDFAPGKKVCPEDLLLDQTTAL